MLSVLHMFAMILIWTFSGQYLLVKFPWHYWTEFSQSWKDLMKTLRNYGNLQSLTDQRLVILNVHDVKSQSINEQQNAIFERCVNSIPYFLKKYKKYDSKVRTYHCSICIEYIYLYQSCTDSVVLISKSAQHCLYSSGKDRCTRYMWSNDMFVL